MKPKHAAAAALGSVQTVPVTALLAQVLLIAGLAVTVDHSGTALSPAAWAVGIASGPERCDHLVRKLGFDGAADRNAPTPYRQLISTETMWPPRLIGWRRGIATRVTAKISTL